MRRLFAPFALCASLACSGATSTDPASTDGSVAVATFNLEEDDGGFTEDSGQEATAIDDELEATESFPEETAAAADPTESAVEADPALAKATRYHLRVVWGAPGKLNKAAGGPKLNPEALATDNERVWDGTIATTSGAIGAVRPIRFEPKEDHLLPRDAKDAVSFVSTTHGYTDGVRLNLIAPKDSTGEIVIALAGVPEIRISHAELDHLMRAQKVDELGNGVAIMAFDKAACGKSSLLGEWKRTSKRGGVFGARIDGPEGQLVGHLRGIWGVRKNGSRRFFGLLARDGQPDAVVRGTWHALPNHAGGLFRGHLIGKGNKHEGVILGHFTTLAPELEALVADSDPVDAGGTDTSTEESTTGADSAGPVGPSGSLEGVLIESCAGGKAPHVKGPKDGAPADLCSADGVCVTEPAPVCDAAAVCTDATDAE